MSVAIFDIDNTLVKGAALMPAAIGLFQAGLIDLSVLPRGVFEQIRFRLASNEPNLVGVLERSLSAIKGVATEEIEDVFNKVAKKIARSSLHMGTVEIARRHIDAGDQVWLATAGPLALATRLAYALGFTGAVGTEVAVYKGRCTGRLAGPLLHGKYKAEAIQTLANENGWVLNEMSAYSDSVNDLPLLKLVGNPHAVNPDRKLRKHAKVEGWPIHDTSSRKTLIKVTGATIGIGAITALHRKR
jgi:HAD superfamily hydrolase (TIGR01490 family)